MPLVTCGLYWANGAQAERKEPRLSTPSSTGLRALVIYPDGSAALMDLPGHAGMAAAHIAALIGGPLEPVTLADAGWVAYVNEEGIRLGLPFNPQADAMARTLGYPFGHGDFIKGPAVWLGRAGFDEISVPDSVVTLARMAGVDLRAPATTEGG